MRPLAQDHITWKWESGDLNPVSSPPPHTSSLYPWGQSMFSKDQPVIMCSPAMSYPSSHICLLSLDLWALGRLP